MPVKLHSFGRDAQIIRFNHLSILTADSWRLVIERTSISLIEVSLMGIDSKKSRVFRSLRRAGFHPGPQPQCVCISDIVSAQERLLETVASLIKENQIVIPWAYVDYEHFTPTELPSLAAQPLPSLVSRGDGSNHDLQPEWASTLWKRSLEALKNKLPAPQFHAWIRPLIVEGVRYGSGKATLHLLAPNAFSASWVNDQLRGQINEAVHSSLPSNADSRFQVEVRPQLLDGRSAHLASQENVGEATCGLLELVADYVVLQGGPTEYRGRCPFHEDEARSLTVNPLDNVFYCCVCNENGSQVDFIMKMLSLRRSEAVKYLAGKKVPHAPPNPSRRQPK